MTMRRFRYFFVLIFMVSMTFSLAACGGGDSDTGAAKESSDAAESSDAGDEPITLKDASGDLIEVEKSDDYGIGGTYVCAADRSVWSFGGDILGVGYIEDDELGSYVCNLEFYTTKADDDGNSYLVVSIENMQTGDTSVWYVTNLVDDDDEVIAINLTQPGDEDTYIRLYTDDYWEKIKDEADND